MKNIYPVYFATVNFLTLRNVFEEHHGRRRPRCGIMDDPVFVAPDVRNSQTPESHLVSTKFPAGQTLTVCVYFAYLQG